MPVILTQLDEQGIAERYDIVIDFSRYNIGNKVWLTNLASIIDGKKPSADLTLAAALGGKSLILASASSWNSASPRIRPSPI